MSDTAQILRAFDQAPPTRVRAPARVRDYVDLLKPRVMSLVVFTGLVGVLIAPVHIHPFEAALAVLAIALGSGAAGAINMWYERDIDALMTRTANRPLPAGRVAPDDALGVGVPMLPVVAGPRETKRQMLLYTLLLAPVALAPTLLGSVGWLYGAVALVMSLAFIAHGIAVWRAPDDRRGHVVARRMFKFSLL